MTVSEVRALVRTLTDEADTTFLSDAKLTSLLRIAYEEFRRLVCTYDTSYYEVSFNYAAPNATSLSLDGTLLGPSATQARALKIVRVTLLDAPNGKPSKLLRPAVSYESLLAGQGFGTLSWWLQNRTMQFSSHVASPLQIQYLPESTVDWSVGTYIDDVVAYHDVIALLAMNNYRVMDAAPNVPQQEQLAKKLADMKAFLSAGRSGEATRYVTEEFHEGSGWY